MPLIKRLKKHKLLLDTHVWLWVFNGDERLSKAFLTAIEIAQTHDGILVSPISIWELGMLVAKARVQLDMDCLDWVQQTMDSPGVVLAPLTPRGAIESTRLPGEIHADPADRILVATAHEASAVLVTCDQKLLDYGQNHYVSVYNPER